MSLRSVSAPSAVGVLTQVMSFASQLDETEERTRKFSIVHVFLASSTLRADTKTCTRTWNVFFVCKVHNIVWGQQEIACGVVVVVVVMGVGLQCNLTTKSGGVCGNFEK